MYNFLKKKGTSKGYNIAKKVQYFRSLGTGARVPISYWKWGLQFHPLVNMKEAEVYILYERPYLLNF